MSQLRSKKALEEILLRRMGVSEQLGGVVRSINDAQDNAEVMKAYETSTKSLATILQNPLLSADRVEKTTEDLAAQLANQREVDDAIRIGGAVAVGGAAGGEVIDDDDLEKELEGLVLEEKQSQERMKVEAREKEAKEKRKREDAEQKVLEERLKKISAQQPAKPQGVETAQIGSTPGKSQGVAAGDKATEGEWKKQYEAAQSREREEKARAEIERLKREEKRMAEAS